MSDDELRRVREHLDEREARRRGWTRLLSGCGWFVLLGFVALMIVLFILQKTIWD
jgi:hypothetical protein